MKTAETIAADKHPTHAERALTSRVSAVILKCVACSGGSYSEARKCRVKTCALWPWRPGFTKAQRQALAEHG